LAVRDLTTLALLPRIAAAFKGGDDYLLSRVVRLIEEQGFRVRGAHEVAPEILVPQGSLGRVQPTEGDKAAIAFGLDYLHATGRFDVGQAVVVAKKHVLAVEAAEGTDQTLARVAELRANGRVRSPPGTGVLVKAPKPGQDRRFDLPSIGPQTVEGVARRPCRHRLGERQSSPSRRGWWKPPMAPTSSYSCTIRARTVNPMYFDGGRSATAWQPSLPPSGTDDGGAISWLAPMGGRRVPSLFPWVTLAMIGFAAIPGLAENRAAFVKLPMR
jgi:hypothetical protein